MEVVKDASLDDRLHVGDMIRRQIAGVVKLDLGVVGLAEHGVEREEMIVRADVEREAEAMKEADGPELGTGR